MAIYYKANPKVVEHLRLADKRYKLRDGNYLLWQMDISAFGNVFDYVEICKSIGALPLQPHEAKQEQDGTVSRTLPTATDTRFVMPVADGAGESTEEMLNAEETETETSTTTAEEGTV